MSSLPLLSKNPDPAPLAKGLLLHICCGPCGSGCLPRLLSAGREVTLYFSNSNLCSFEEYEKRLTAVRTLAEAYGIPVLTDPYDHEAWLKSLAELEHFEDCPERGARCGLCFRYSLTRTALKAAELALPFATTLTVSPHKNSDLIFRIGGAWQNFEPWDFKKRDGFRLSVAESKRLKLYRQAFCGCEFSLRATGMQTGE